MKSSLAAVNSVLTNASEMGDKVLKVCSSIGALVPGPFETFCANKLSPVWLDFAKFHHFGMTLQNFCLFESILLVFGKFLNLLW